MLKKRRFLPEENYPDVIQRTCAGKDSCMLHPRGQISYSLGMSYVLANPHTCSLRTGLLRIWHLCAQSNMLVLRVHAACGFCCTHGLSILHTLMCVLGSGWASRPSTTLAQHVWPSTYTSRPCAVVVVDLSRLSRETIGRSFTSGPRAMKAERPWA